MDGAFELFSEDAVTWLAGLPAACAHLVVLDPGVPGRAPRRAKKGDPAIPAFPEARLPALLYEVHRVLARDRLCWWVSEGAHVFRAARTAERLGFAVGAPLTWDRGDGPGARIAFVLPLSNGRLRSPGAELVQAPRPEDDATSLPRVLCEALVDAGSERGELVVDPCMGRGAVGAAALELGRDFLGNDLVPLMEVAAEKLARWGRPAEASPSGLRSGSVRGRPADANPLPGINGVAQLTIFGDGAQLR